MKLVDKQNIFNSGILSSKLYSRDDLKQYNNGIADALNFICSRYGPMEKRTGTEHIYNLNNPGEKVFLMPFIFSIHQTLILEFIEGYIRFYTYGTDENGIFRFNAVSDDQGNHYIIETPFTENQIEHLSYVQSLDVIYLAFADGKTPPYTLTRKDKLDWRLEVFETDDGPYLDQNYRVDRTMRILDTSTEYSIIALENFSLGSEDIGRWIRICTPRYNENTYAYEDKWSYGKIVNVGIEGAWENIDNNAYTKVKYEDIVTGTSGSTVSRLYKDDQTKTAYHVIPSVPTNISYGYISFKEEIPRTDKNGKPVLDSNENPIIDKYITVDGVTNSISGETENGKRFKYKKQINEQVWAWIQDESIFSDVYTQLEYNNIVINTSLLYTDKETTNPYLDSTKGLIKEKQTIDTEKYIRVENQWFKYKETITENNTTYVVWTREKVYIERIFLLDNYNTSTNKNVYSDPEHTNKIGEIVAVNDKGASVTVWITAYGTGATNTILRRLEYRNTSNSISVDWKYRNFVNDQNKSWMTTATTEWRLGAWHSGYSNEDYPATYPTKVAIHQQRLVWAGMTDRPWIWTSNSFAYKNYAYSDYEGEITDTNSIYYDISSDKISEIFWLKSVKSLLVGTEMGEIRLYSAGTAITPSDVVSVMESSYGSHNSEPVVNDDNIVFIQRLQRTIRSLSYDYNQDAFVGPELTILAEGLTVGGIKKIVFQKEPNNTYWCLKEDGTLLSLTYDKAQDVIGWSRSELAGTDVKVIDMAVIPSDVYLQDVLILVTERKVNNQVCRYLELLSRNFNKDVAQKDALFLDDAIRLEDALRRHDDTIVIEDDDTFTEVQGLDFLEGETVRVIDRGSLEGDFVVTNGMITLNSPCHKDAWIGLPYDSFFETLERDYQDKQLSTKMSKLRVYKLRMYIERTLGLQLKRLDRGSESKLITFDPTSLMDVAPKLLTGKVDVAIGSAWDCDYRLRIDSEPGFPCTVAGLIMGLEINEL